MTKSRFPKDINKMSIEDLIDTLAQKAANKYNRSSKRMQEWYNEQGTSILFEDYPDAYYRILEPSDEDLEAMNCEDEAELFWKLDDKFCELL